jgi:hypothetical protein
LKMNNLKTLKEKVIERFGSVRAFAFHPGQVVPSWTVIRVFRGEKKRNQEELFELLEKQAKILKPSKNKISAGQRELIRRTILIHYKTTTDFCSVYPDFSRTFVSDVIRGKKTTFDARTKKLFVLILKLHTTKENEFERLGQD